MQKIRLVTAAILISFVLIPIGIAVAQSCPQGYVPCGANSCCPN